MTDHLIAIGCDSSKGRIDVEIRNDHGTVLHTGAYDDTPDDHVAFSRIVDGLLERFPTARLLAGIESTGGMERNWLAFFRREKRWVKCLRAFKLNAAAVSAFRSTQLHRAPGDRAAASDIAKFLLERCAARTPDVEADSGPIMFYRTIRSMSCELISASQRLQTHLVAIQPDLVRFCRHGIPAWVLILLDRYPTAAALARARPSSIDAIPHVDAERAAELIDNAKRSVASMTDQATAATIRFLVSRIRDTQERIDRARAELLDLIRTDPQSPLAKAVDLLDSIPGIGPWSAACLACEIGDPARFAHPKAVIAWAGLDPVAKASGDEHHNCGISHRGNAHVRAVLFPLAMASVTHNPIMKEFHHRLINTNGKTHLVSLVAVMAKILRIAYAVLASGKPFDAGHEAKRREQAQAEQAERSKATPQVIAPPSPRLDSPISNREAIRRKNAATPSAEVRDLSPRRASGRGPRKQVSVPSDAAKG